MLLSGFARVKKGEQALDLGTGTGIIPILLEAKTEGRHFTGLEIQETSADMAQRSVCLNDLQEKSPYCAGRYQVCNGAVWKGLHGCGDLQSTVYDRTARTGESRYAKSHCTA